jgi:uncharacterized membrane protein
MSANLPGVPDDFDLTRLAGWQPLDLEAVRQRQLYIAQRYRVALLTWAAMVAFTLFATIFTGSLMFWVIGFIITPPFLRTVAKYRRAIDNVAEFDALCDLDNEFCE